MRIDIMTDIETLGKDNNTTVFQVAACMFNINTGEILDTFNQIADIKNDKNIPIDGDTLIWWLNTNKELLTSLLNKGTTSQEQLFKNFNDWISKYDTKNTFLWGNGILFDNKLIQSKMNQYNLNYPIFYRNDRDMRTIIELASLKINKPEMEFRNMCKKNTYTAHDGLEDVKAQIDILSTAWNILLKTNDK